MRDVVRKLARQSKTAIIIYKLIDNRRLRKRVASGDIETTHGSTLLKPNLQESLAYIEKQFTDYLKYAGLSAESLKGKQNSRTGARRQSRRRTEISKRRRRVSRLSRPVLFKARPRTRTKRLHVFTEILPAEERRRLDQAVNLSEGVQFNPEKVQSVYGVTLEEFAEKLAHDHEKFDLIVSCGAGGDLRSRSGVCCDGQTVGSGRKYGPCDRSERLRNVSPAEIIR